MRKYLYIIFLCKQNDSDDNGSDHDKINDSYDDNINDDIDDTGDDDCDLDGNSNNNHKNDNIIIVMTIMIRCGVLCVSALPFCNEYDDISF